MTRQSLTANCADQSMDSLYLNHLSMGELLVCQMLGHLSDEQILHAQDIMAERNMGGVVDKRTMNRFICKELMGTTSPKHVKFTNYFDLLKFLYEDRPKSIDREFRNLHPDKQDLLKVYEQEIRGKKSDPRAGGLRGFLSGLENTIYASYSNSPQNSRPAAITCTRVKSYDRGNPKGSHRLLKWEIATELARRRKQKKPEMEVSVHDWFACSVGTYTVEQTYEVVDFLYANLARLGFEPDPLREHKGFNKITGKKEAGFQPPGIDDHIKYGKEDALKLGKGRDASVQIRYRRIGTFRRREIKVFPLAEGIADEIDHVRLLQSREKDRLDLIHSKRAYKKRSQLFEMRARQLTSGIPKLDLIEGAELYG
jgi:hypothetical protein